MKQSTGRKTFVHALNRGVDDWSRKSIKFMSVIIIGRIDLMITKGTVSVILMALNARWKCSYNNGTLDN